MFSRTVPFSLKMLFDDLPTEVVDFIVSFLRIVGTPADVQRLFLASLATQRIVSIPVMFSAHFNSNYGENVYLIGNTEDLGTFSFSVSL